MRRRVLYSVLMVLALTSTVLAQTDPYKDKREHYTGRLWNFPVYDPSSKSYFELVEVKKGTWPVARAFAMRQVFNGVRGRLAIIKSKDTQDFLVKTFRPPKEVWIGLRMFCFRRQFIWVTGERLDRRKDYQNWGREWHYRDRYTPCKGGPRTMNGQYAGITLAPFEGVVRWFAIQPQHAVNVAFIEYPTGRP